MHLNSQGQYEASMNLKVIFDLKNTTLVIYILIVHLTLIQNHYEQEKGKVLHTVFKCLLYYDTVCPYIF